MAVFNSSNGTTSGVNFSSTTTAPVGDVCDKISLALDTRFILGCIAPALILIFATSFSRKRIQLYQSCLSGRPGVNYPIDFLNDNGRRLAYAAAFGIITYRMMDLILGERYVRPKQFDDPRWMSKYQFTSSLIGLFNIILVALVFFPFLVFIVLRRNIIANILGLIYTTVWFSLLIETIVRCAHITVGKYSTETTSTLRQLLSDIPMITCHIVLLVAYMYDLVVNVRNLLRQKDRKAALMYSFTFGEPLHMEEHIQYVQALLKKSTKQPPSTMKDKIKAFMTYEKVPGFRYSTRIICTVTVTAMGLYKVIISATVWINFLLVVFKYYSDSLLSDVQNSTNRALAKDLSDLVNILPVTFNISNVVAALLQVVGLVLLVLNYRKNVGALIKGDRSWFFKNQASPASQIVDFWKFSGYQIVSSVYSYLIFLLMLWLVLVAVTYGLILPIRDGYSNWLTRKILQLWPTLVISLALYFGQILAAKFIFLDERGASLAIINRRVFHVTTFFMFFSNILLGLFGIIKRVVIGMVVGLLMLNRLDRCLLMRGWERFDTGFKSYLGMLEVDLHHNHPIVRYFVHVVLERIQEKHADALEKHTPIVTVDMKGEEKIDLAKTARHKAVRMKWQKALTLLHNPTILLERMERKARAKQIAKAQAKIKKADESDFRDTTRDLMGAGAVAMLGTAVVGAAKAGTTLTDGVTETVANNALEVSNMLDV